MFDKEIKVNKLLRNYCLKLVEDIPKKDFNLQVIKGSLSPAWVLGHLTYELNRSANWLGLNLEFNYEWGDYFSQGKGPECLNNRWDKELLIYEFSRTHDLFCQLLPGLQGSILEEENPSLILSDYLPKKKHDVTHMLTSHLAIHCGHLGMWRKQYGLNNQYGR